VSEGFPGRIWEELCQEILVNPARHEEWKRAEKIHDGLEKRYWKNPSTLRACTVQGMRLQRFRRGLEVFVGWSDALSLHSHLWLHKEPGPYWTFATL